MRDLYKKYTKYKRGLLKCALLLLWEKLCPLEFRIGSQLEVSVHRQHLVFSVCRNTDAVGIFKNSLFSLHNLDQR